MRSYVLLDSERLLGDYSPSCLEGEFYEVRRGICDEGLLDGARVWLLWRGLRAGAVLAVALLPFELAFWIGFALPLGPPLGLARAILVIMKWSSFPQPSN